MDEIHFAPPKKPWNDDSPANTNEQWFPMVLKVVQDFVHPQYCAIYSCSKKELFQTELVLSRAGSFERDCIASAAAGKVQSGLLPLIFRPIPRSMQPLPKPFWDPSLVGEFTTHLSRVILVGR